MHYEVACNSLQFGGEMINKYLVPLLTGLDKSLTQSEEIILGSSYLIVHDNLPKPGIREVRSQHLELPKHETQSPINFNYEAKLIFSAIKIHQSLSCSEPGLFSPIYYLKFVYRIFFFFLSFLHKSGCSIMSLVVILHLVFWVSACEQHAAGNETFMDCVYLVAMETQMIDSQSIGYIHRCHPLQKTHKTAAYFIRLL